MQPTRHCRDRHASRVFECDSRMFASTMRSCITTGGKYIPRHSVLIIFVIITIHLQLRLPLRSFTAPINIYHFHPLPLSPSTAFTFYQFYHSHQHPQLTSPQPLLRSIPFSPSPSHHSSLSRLAYARVCKHLHSITSTQTPASIYSPSAVYTSKQHAKVRLLRLPRPRSVRTEGYRCALRSGRSTRPLRL